MSSWNNSKPINKIYSIYTTYLSEDSDIINLNIDNFILHYKITDIALIYNKKENKLYTLTYNNTFLKYYLYINNIAHVIDKPIISIPYYNNKYNIIDTNSIIIPKTIVTTWKTKELQDTELKFPISINKSLNPSFNLIIFDDNDCIDFLREHYDSDVIDAYNSLKPTAYKADLWRYCYLYKYGGIYVDVKTSFRVSLSSLINNNIELLLVHDINDNITNNGIYNGLIACTPNHPLLKYAIDESVIRIKNKYYGKNPLDITGPLLFEYCFNKLYNISSSEYLKNQNIHSIKMLHLHNTNSNIIKYNKNIVASRTFSSYYNKYNDNTIKSSSYYVNLWNNRLVYN
jgi:mannosyltransferase OCH1-like enzyme